MQISFGRGVDQFWTNVFPSELVAKHEENIKRFGKVLQTVKKLEVVFAVVSVQGMLKLFRFPQVSYLRPLEILCLMYPVR